MTTTTTPTIKICGLTRVEDVEAAVAAGADLLGFNFWPRSPRHIDRETAAHLAAVARREAEARGHELLIAGVFVNQSREEIEGIDTAVGLDLIQLHGDEPPAFGAPFGGRLLRALRTAGVPDGKAFAAYPQAWGFLVDVADAVRYGGTGEGWNYGELAAALPLPTGQPVLIAGGICPGNARAALEAAGAAGVDLCSGVEAAPGIKDVPAMQTVILEVHHGEAATTP